MKWFVHSIHLFPYYQLGVDLCTCMDTHSYWYTSLFDAGYLTGSINKCTFYKHQDSTIQLNYCCGGQQTSTKRFSKAVPEHVRTWQMGRRLMLDAWFAKDSLNAVFWRWETWIHFLSRMASFCGIWQGDLTDDVKHASKAKTNNIVALENAWWTLHSAPVGLTRSRTSTKVDLKAFHCHCRRPHYSAQADSFIHSLKCWVYHPITVCMLYLDTCYRVWAGHIIIQYLNIYVK